MKPYNNHTLEELFDIYVKAYADPLSSSCPGGRRHAIQAVAEACTPSQDENGAIHNILALIHRDGGHYEHTHGRLKALQDCEEALNTRLIEYARDCTQRLAEALDGLINAVALDALGNGISGYTGARLTDAKEALDAYNKSK